MTRSNTVSSPLASAMASASSASAMRRSSVLPTTISRQYAERRSAAPRVRARESLERLFEHLDALGVDRTEIAEQPAVQREGSGDEAVGVVERDGIPGRAEQGLPERRVTGLSLSRAESDREVEAQHGVGLRQRRPDAERVVVVPERVRRRERAERRVAGEARVPDGSGRVEPVGATGPVPGELGQPWSGVAGAQALERLADAPVRPRRVVSARAPRTACAGSARG